MSNDTVLIVTILIESWTENGIVYPPSIMRWILKTTMDIVYDPDGGMNKNEIMAELVKRQPQLEGKTVLDIEQVFMEVA